MEKLKAFRESKGLSQPAIAQRMGVSLSFYEKVERCHVSASRAFMQKMKKAFPDANIDDIFFNAQEMEKLEV